jgi:hypothetical protein
MAAGNEYNSDGYYTFIKIVSGWTEVPTRNPKSWLQVKIVMAYVTDRMREGRFA